MKTPRIALAAFALASFSSSAIAADLAKGKTLFEQRCSTCHGNTGEGDGPIAAGLPADQKPAKLSAGVYKFFKDDASFKELLHKGGAAVGLSPLMPPQPDLADDDIGSLLIFVRSLKK